MGGTIIGSLTGLNQRTMSLYYYSQHWKPPEPPPNTTADTAGKLAALAPARLIYAIDDNLTHTGRRFSTSCTLTTPRAIHAACRLRESRATAAAAVGLWQQQEALDAAKGDNRLIDRLDRPREGVELLDEDVAQPEDDIRFLDLHGSSRR